MREIDKEKSSSGKERRDGIMLFLSRKRKTHYSELTQIFNVSNPTIKKDLDILEETYRIPLIRQTGTDGYIAVLDGWYLNTVYLSPNEEHLLNTVSAVIRNNDIYNALSDTSRTNLGEQILNLKKKFSKPVVNE